MLRAQVDALHQCWTWPVGIQEGNLAQALPLVSVCCQVTCAQPKQHRLRPESTPARHAVRGCGVSVGAGVADTVAPCLVGSPPSRLSWWNHCADYFPTQLIKTADLDPDGRYIFVVAPHGGEQQGSQGSARPNSV